MCYVAIEVTVYISQENYKPPNLEAFIYVDQIEKCLHFYQIH